MTATAAADPRSRVAHPPGALTTRVVYDVIVLGGQLAGTLTGALLAKRGYRVLQIDPQGETAFYEHQSYQLPWAPSLLPALKLMPRADASLIELGVAVDLNRALESASADLQLIFPTHRLSLSADRVRRATEVAREFDDQKQSILAALDATSAAAETGDPFFRSALPLPPEGFFDRRAIRRALRECPAMCCGDEQLRAIEGHPFAEALEALAGFVTHLRNDGRSTPAQRRPLGQILRGAYRFPGGSIGLRDTLRSRLTELGGAWIGEGTGPAKIEELLFERGRFAGVRLASSGNVFRASCLVAATDVSTLAPLLPPAMKKRRMTQLLGSVRASRSLLSVNLVVRADGLPLGLGELALIVPGDEQAGPILLEVLKAQKAGHEVSEERVLCAAALISVADSQAGEGRLRELAGRIEAAVLELAPFVDPHLIARSVPALDAGGAAGRRSASPALIEVGNDRLLGIAGLPHRTPCRNLLLSSSEVLPGLGLEGELVSGARAADLVQEALRKHDPLK